MMSGTWLNKRSLILVHPLPTIIWYISIDKSDVEGAVGFSIICQGTWKESLPVVHRVIETQTLIPAVDPAVVCKLVSSPLGCGPGEYSLTQSYIDKTVLVEIQTPSGEVPAHHCYSKNKNKNKNKKHKKFGCIGQAKRNSLTLPNHVSPKMAQFRAKRDFSQPMISPEGESEMVWASTKLPQL